MASIKSHKWHALAKETNVTDNRAVCHREPVGYIFRHKHLHWAKRFWGKPSHSEPSECIYSPWQPYSSLLLVKFHIWLIGALECMSKMFSFPSGLGWDSRRRFTSWCVAVYFTCLTCHALLRDFNSCFGAAVQPNRDDLQCSLLHSDLKMWERCER